MNIKTGTISLFVLFLAACNAYEETTEQQKEEGKEIRFRIYNPETTRAESMTTFRVGDSIGIYAVKRMDKNSPALPTASGNQGHNAKWILTEEGWTPATPADRIVWTPDGTPLDFYAYYPYQRNASDPTAILLITAKDQREGETFLHTDFLRAANTEGQTNGEVELHFNHLFSQVEITLSQPPVDPDSWSVTMVNVLTTATLHLGKGTLATDTKGEVALHTTGNGRFAGILPPQTIEAGTPFAHCENGPAMYIYTPSHAFTLSSGERQRIELTLK